MRSIDLIRENLKHSEGIVLSRIEDMRGHCLVFSAPTGGCHTLWVLGHLAYIESLVIRSFMLGAPNPLAEWHSLFDSDEVSSDETIFPPFEQVLEECRKIRASTISLLNSFTEEDLDTTARNAPSGTENLFGTYRRCFQYTANHWYMHRGQLADARSAAGIERMWY